MKCLFAYIFSMVLLASAARAEVPNDFSGSFRDGESAKVIQFLNDPEISTVGWMLTESLLQYNPQVGGNGEWKIRFDGERFERATGIPAGSGYRHKRIQTSKRAGSLYLLLDADVSGKTISYIFRTNDFGETWQYSKMVKNEAIASAAPAAVAPARANAPRKKGKEVDLRSMASEPVPGGAPNPHAATEKTQPLFRILFDLLLQIRPGANPWTFDNYHTLFLVEIFPRPELQFSFEVSPTPRYYELKYKISESVTLRGGRIWIPFDRMSPHNTFGGFMNTSLLRQPGTSAFLPDLWTDLGLGLDWKIANTAEFMFDFQFYVVNGYRDGGSDPSGEVGTRYPNFENAPTLDSNGDKAMGIRLAGKIGNVFGFGGSIYSGRYTAQSDAPRRVTLLGIDTQISPMPGTTLAAGYLYGHIGLPPGSTVSKAIRGGFYAEFRQKFAEKWHLTLRGGASQNDNRVQDPSDQTILGGSIGYDLGLVRLSFQHFRDLLKVPGKVVHEYTALRAVALF